MTCREIEPGAIVCGPPPGIVCRTYAMCGHCEKRTRFIRRFGGVWYGDDWTCVRCGDSYCVEGRYPRPFVRGWRKAAITKARAQWADPRTLTPREFRAYTRRALEDALGGSDV